MPGNARWKNGRDKTNRKSTNTYTHTYKFLYYGRESRGNHKTTIAIFHLQKSLKLSAPQRLLDANCPVLWYTDTHTHTTHYTLFAKIGWMFTLAEDVVVSTIATARATATPMLHIYIYIYRNQWAWQTFFHSFFFLFQIVQCIRIDGRKKHSHTTHTNINIQTHKLM